MWIPSYNLRLGSGTLFKKIVTFPSFDVIENRKCVLLIPSYSYNISALIQNQAVFPYLRNASNTLEFFLALMYSPICFLSSLGFSLRNPATWSGSNGDLRMPCSCRKAIPLDGFWLNCSLPANMIWKKEDQAILTAG